MKAKKAKIKPKKRFFSDKVDSCTTEKEKMDCRANNEKITDMLNQNDFLMQSNGRRKKYFSVSLPPKQVRDYVEQWKKSAENDKSYKPEHRAMLDDILQLIDVAVKVLQPNPRYASAEG